MATIHIQSGKIQLKCNKKPMDVQSIPFRIHADSDANVTDYFKSYVESSDSENMETSFRGYLLRGKKVELPEEYAGLLLHESIRPDREKDERKFYVVGQFNEMTCWNWDKKASLNDGITQALQWIDIAEALHNPVLEE